jgi:hypothetical protein
LRQFEALAIGEKPVPLQAAGWKGAPIVDVLPQGLDAGNILAKAVGAPVLTFR